MQQLDQTLPPHPLGPYKRPRGGHPLIGNVSPSCRGGYTNQGYVREYSPDHPNADRQGFLFQHRLVAECYLGRLLTKKEQVHHKNGDRQDNRWENLEVMSQQEHYAHHHQPIPLTEERVKAALLGRSISLAAALLGVHPQTLRNRFDHLLTKRRTAGQAYPQYLVQQTRELAADPKMSMRAASPLLGISVMTLIRVCQMEGIAWQAAHSGRPKTHRPA